MVGRAVGREEGAAAEVADARARPGELAADHPDRAGRTAAVAAYWDSALSVYGPWDVSWQVLAELVLVTPPAVAELMPDGEIHATVSEQRLDLLDADLLVWLADGSRLVIEALPLRSTLPCPGGAGDLRRRAPDLGPHPWDAAEPSLRARPLGDDDRGRPGRRPHHGGPARRGRADGLRQP